MTPIELRDAINQKKLVVYAGKIYRPVGYQLLQFKKQKFVSAGIQDVKAKSSYRWVPLADVSEYEKES